MCSLHGAPLLPASQPGRLCVHVQRRCLASRSSLRCSGRHCLRCVPRLQRMNASCPSGTARPFLICTSTGLAPRTSAPGLACAPFEPLPVSMRDLAWSRCVPECVCATGRCSRGLCLSLSLAAALPVMPCGPSRGVMARTTHAPVVPRTSLRVAVQLVRSVQDTSGPRPGPLGPEGIPADALATLFGSAGDTDESAVCSTVVSRLVPVQMWAE
jgi:hypothetical protein